MAKNRVINEARKNAAKERNRKNRQDAVRIFLIYSVFVIISVALFLHSAYPQNNDTVRKTEILVANALLALSANGIVVLIAEETSIKKVDQHLVLHYSLLALAILSAILAVLLAITKELTFYYCQMLIVTVATLLIGMAAGVYSFAVGGVFDKLDEKGVLYYKEAAIFVAVTMILAICIAKMPIITALEKEIRDIFYSVFLAEATNTIVHFICRCKRFRNRNQCGMHITFGAMAMLIVLLMIMWLLIVGDMVETVEKTGLALVGLFLGVHTSAGDNLLITAREKRKAELNHKFPKK